jgi:hypothetical protein
VPAAEGGVGDSACTSSSVQKGLQSKAPVAKVLNVKTPEVQVAQIDVQSVSTADSIWASLESSAPSSTTDAASASSQVKDA